MAALPGPIDSDRLLALLRRLIDTYSPSGKEEDILRLVESVLSEAGLPVQRQAIDDRRYNLLVVPDGAEIDLALIGHLDTVPAYELDRFASRQIGDQIFGLGAADMKGGCAALMEAYRLAWQATSGHLPVALALVVGEEEEGDGSARLVEELDFSWALIAEPTGLLPCPGSYGYVECSLRSQGLRRHASLADRTVSAVEAVLDGAQGILEHLRTAHPELVINVRDLLSARAGFAVPESCEVWFDIHLPPEGRPETLIADLEAIALAPAREEREPRLQLRFTTVDHGYWLEEQGRLTGILRRVLEGAGLGWHPEPFRSHSDANLLWGAGVRPVLLGPGRLEKAHAPDESVRFGEVADAARIYLETVLGFG